MHPNRANSIFLAKRTFTSMTSNCRLPSRKLWAAVAAVHPFEGRVFNGLEAAPWPATVDDPGLEQPVDHLGARGVVSFTDAIHRRFDACLGQPFAVANG